MFIQIIEQSSRLAFVDDQSGELFQTSTMMAEFDHPRHDSDLARIGDVQGTKLLDIETKLVQSSNSSSDLMAIVDRNNLFSDYFVPEAVVSNSKFVTDQHRVQTSLMQSTGSFKIQHFAADVVTREIEIVAALAV